MSRLLLPTAVKSEIGCGAVRVDTWVKRQLRVQWAPVTSRMDLAQALSDTLR